MATTSTTISPVDALWALYQAQSKKNKKAFRSLLAKEDEELKGKSFMAISTPVHSKTFDDKDYITINSIEELHRWLDSL